MNSYVLMTIATMMLVAIIGITTTTTVLAENPKDGSPANTWGKAASNFLAKDGEMGQHASNPGDLDPSSPSREGLGNVARATGGDHPSDIPGVLCSPPTPPNDPRCVSNP
jgi:hypothetical protein